MLYDSNYMTLWKRKNYGDSKKIVKSGCQAFRWREGQVGGAQGNIKAVQLYCMMLCSQVHDTFVKSPNVNGGH